MVIHDDGEVPTEVSVIRKPLFEPTSYVIVKNHVRELVNIVENKPEVNVRDEQIQQNMETETKKKQRKLLKKGKKIDRSTTDDKTLSNVTEVSKSDLEELKSVYQQCKLVMEKIETKYGHLLNLIDKTSTQDPKTAEDYELENECQCTLNKKIIFDDNGEQSTIGSELGNHICRKRLKKSPSIFKENIEIEYMEREITLPDDIKELTNMLQNPNIEITYRNKVIDKVRLMKQDLINELKFNKHSIIDKLKLNPDELLNFKGTNLSTLSGYPS